MEEAIIGVLGAGILGMLGFFFQSIKSDTRALGERMGRIEAILVNVVERLTRIETVQAEHSRILAEHSRILAEHSRTLDEHSRILAEHGRVLAEHSRMLAETVGFGERITALEGAAAAG